ncbi:PREDICTED: A disintegrin and metalloproteinase with thrombospondin motifs 18-like [Acropora digitifera]|uniref:A disintegrin and metalloproteinase with thrombospondin motifs 18-like n=1 Tax=Acropora digitifera TaxID=70779 RepID=UPI00077ACA60|nr:PREDICTED: A disintegrin and metalloproteinase with thrombospondin motifs 18-like [Acropora digitifera]
MLIASGVIHTQDGAYFMEPLPVHLHDRVIAKGRSKPHVFYRRSITLDDEQEIHDARERREIHTCGTQDDPRIRVSRSLNETELSKRQGPAGPGEEKYIETLVVVDPKMANFHGEDAAKQYVVHGSTPRVRLYNICKDKNQPCHTLGLTRTRGMCIFPNSASVSQDNGLMLGITLAHETGHSHLCFVCNIISLSSDDSRCLDDNPTKKNVIETRTLDKAGRLYDTDEQCQLAYGQSAKFCGGDKFLEQVCVKLWCEVPGGSGNCKTAGVPAADGTPCGNDKWCRRGECIQLGTEGPDTVDGAWSTWSSKYSECSRTCGGGVQYKERRCNTPRPKNGGKRCEGQERDYKLCNTEACSTELVDFRNHQCQTKNSQLFNDQYYEWEWKPSTLTTKDEDENNKVGCDGVIGSNAVVDRCGLCNGDGSSCSPGSKADVTNVNTTSTKKAVTPGSGTSNLITSALNWLKRMGYDVDRRGQIASPESATKETEKDEFYWAVVKSGCSVSCGGGSEVSSAECRRSDDGSPVNEEKCDAGQKPPRATVHCNYQPCPPIWKPEGWEDCSKTCSGGNRTREVKCMQVAADGIEYDVDHRLCTDPKPSMVEACNNIPCPAEWVAQPFGALFGDAVCGNGFKEEGEECDCGNVEVIVG